MKPYMSVDQSIYDYAKESTENYNNKHYAYEYFGKNITYSSAKEEIENAAKIFRKNGAKKGDVIAVISPLFPEVVASFYGASKNGTTFFPIDPRTNPSRIADFLNLAEVKQAVMLDQAFGKVDKIIDQTKLEHVSVISPIDSMKFILGKVFRYDQLKKTDAYYKLKEKLQSLKKEDELEEIIVNELLEEYEKKEKYDSLTFKDKQFVKNLKAYAKLKDTALKNLYYSKKSRIGYVNWKDEKKQIVDVDDFESIYDKDIPASITLTSGTTGKPKAVPTSSRSYNVKVRDYYYDTTMPIEAGDRMLSMPPFIMYGETFMHMAYCRGIQNVVIPDITAYKYGDVVLKKKINHLVGVPSQMLCFDEDERLDTPPKYIKSVSVGGTKMLLSHERKINAHLEKIGLKVTQGYSLSELTPASYTNMPGHIKEQSVGIAIGDTKGLVVDDKTFEILGPNQKGLLFVNSETQFDGYYKNEEATKGMFKYFDRLKYVNTGDYAYYDEDGYYFILDRKKEMIIRPDGHNVFPSELEEIISSHYAVKDCAVTGIPYPNYEEPQGEYPRAHVVLEDEYKDSKDRIEIELKELCSANLPERDVAYDYRFDDTLPLTPVLKVDKEKLKEIDRDELSDSKKFVKK